MKCLSLASAIAALLAASATAQSGFGGSFDDTPTQQPPAQSAPDQGGGFGGSFDGGGQAPAPVVPPPATQTPAPAPAPGGDNFGGSFGSGDQQVVTPQPNQQPQPPVVNTQPQPPVVNTAPQPRPQPGAVSIDPQILAFEGRDFGVPPTNQLKQGQLHAPTPTAVPGANVVSTVALANAIATGQEMVLIDVLGGQYSLPRALMAPALASPGHFGDRTQQQATQWLGQITGGRADLPIVIYCSDPQCWLSYNATLRTVAAGFRNVYWYRGGLTAWQMAGLQLMPSGM